MTPFEAFLECKAVSTDTRNIAHGSVFFALKGERFNGNEFALQALAEGASYAVVDEPVGEDHRLLRVDDVLTALQDCAKQYRKHLGITIIGLTGSNGKTTNKELFHAVLTTQFKVHATKGSSSNNSYGFTFCHIK
jgi:UDP-N-acetylmuramoyl-tripeptide--D-alanyl-D-alanine ligase